jgi:hypothetical protein
VASLTAGTPAAQLGDRQPRQMAELVGGTGDQDGGDLSPSGRGARRLLDGGEPVQPEDRDHAVAAEPRGPVAQRVDRRRRGPRLVGRPRPRHVREVWGSPGVPEVEPGELLAGADDVEGLDEAGRGGGHLAGAAEEGEGGLGQPHQAGAGRRRPEPLERQPEHDRVELHELRERSPDAVVGEDLGQQVPAEAGRATPLLGREREPGARARLGDRRRPAGDPAAQGRWNSATTGAWSDSG